MLLYLPLFRLVKGGPPQGVSPGFSLLANSYQFHFAPAVGVLTAALMLYFVSMFGWPELEPPSAAWKQKEPLDPSEIVALLGFLAMPVFCFLLAKVMGVPLYSRYSISAVIGFSCLFGMVTAQKRLVGWGVLFFLFTQIAINFYQYAKTDSISEPSVSLALSTRASEFAQIYQTMEALPDKSAPIVLLGGDHEFLPIMHYAPTNIASRLVYVMSPGNDVNGEGCAILRRLCNFPGRCERMADFLAAHDTFFAHGNSDPFDRLGRFIRAGADVRMEFVSENSYFGSVTMNSSILPPSWQRPAACRRCLRSSATYPDRTTHLSAERFLLFHLRRAEHGVAQSGRETETDSRVSLARFCRRPRPQPPGGRTAVPAYFR